MTVLLALDHDGTTAGLYQTETGVLLHTADGSERTVPEQPVTALLAAHARELLPVVGESISLRSDVVAGCELAVLLEQHLGEEAAEAELIVNGVYYQRVPVEDETTAVWLPDDPAVDEGADLLLQSHWDLLSGTPSMTTGNPGTTTLVRIGDVSVVHDPSAEILMAARGPEVPALPDVGDLLIGHQVTRIDSSWIAGDPSRVEQLWQLDAYSVSRALYVNDRLWHRTADGWRDTPAEPIEDEVLAELGRGARPDRVEAAALEGTDRRPLALRPVGDAAAVGRGADRVVLVPGAIPTLAQAVTVTQAALKATREVVPARVFRVVVGEQVRFGVRVAGDAAEICRGLGLPGWLEVQEDGGGATGAWVRADGQAGAAWSATRDATDGFDHPIVTDEWDAA